MAKLIILTRSELIKLENIKFKQLMLSCTDKMDREEFLNYWNIQAVYSLNR